MLTLFMLIAIYCLVTISSRQTVMTIFLLVIYIFLSLSAIWMPKTFRLYTDKLVIGRPLFFLFKTETTIPVADLKSVMFKRISGRFGGPMMVISARRENHDFRIDFSNIDANEFAAKLNSLKVFVIVSENY